jgi:hypothetical protein
MCIHMCVGMSNDVLVVWSVPRHIETRLQVICFQRPHVTQDTTDTNEHM